MGHTVNTVFNSSCGAVSGHHTIDVKIDMELLAFIPHKYYFFNVVSLNFME